MVMHARTIPTVSISWIHPFVEILDAVGVSSDHLLREANLPGLAIDDGSLPVPTEKVYEFVYLACRESGLSDLGFRAGAGLEIAPLMPAGGRVAHRSGAFDTIESFITVCLDSSTNVDLWIESESNRDGMIEFVYDGTFGSEHPAFVTVEQFMLTLMVRIPRYAAGLGWNPAVANFRSRSVPIGAAQRLFGDAEIRCGEKRTSLEFPSQLLEHSFQGAPRDDSIAWNRHRGERPAGYQGDLIAFLRKTLASYLPDGSTDINLAARLARTSVRTLQRRLAEEGTTYSELLEEVRYDAAVARLKDSRSTITEVGRQLGYRDPAIFTRAFRRWTGTTPSEFRKILNVS
jgi:AraC-like DNA-binding protein